MYCERMSRVWVRLGGEVRLLSSLRGDKEFLWLYYGNILITSLSREQKIKSAMTSPQELRLYDDNDPDNEDAG